MAERIERFELVACSRGPVDDDIGCEDNTGSIVVTFARYESRRGACIGVTVTATGGYATWTREELKAEAQYLLNN